MAAPVTGEANLAGEHSDPHLTENELKSPNSAEDHFTITQLMKASTARPKRRYTKRMRSEVSPTDVRKEHLASKIKIVARKTLSPYSSLKKQKSPAKALKPPIPDSPAMIRARKFQSSLRTKFPTFIKTMVRSQVTYGFWMGLPLPFCRSFLPKADTTFTLEGENGKLYEAKYLAYKSGFSGGWKYFVAGNKLLEGDVLVFHLVEPLKFKIYIIRGNDSNGVDGALSPINLEAHEEEITPVTPSPKPKKRKQPESPYLTVVKKKHKNSSSAPPPKTPSKLLEPSGTNSEDTISEVLESSTPFHDFRITVNGLCLDSELPEAVKTSYNKLCLQNKQVLHDNLPEGLYYKLVAGMIGETVNIANEIRNCKLTTTKEEFEAWDNSLKSFEILGMKVGFLREKIRTLSRLVFESEGAEDIKRYVEAKSEQKLIEDEIKKVSERLLELKETARNFEGISGCFKEKAQRFIIEFEDEVDALG